MISHISDVSISERIIMAVWTVTAEAIAAMEQINSQLVNESQKISTETNNIFNTFEECKNGLGAHSDDIQDLIREIREQNKEAEKIIQKLRLKLQRAIIIRKKHLENSRYTGTQTRIQSATGNGSGEGGRTLSAVDERTIFELESFLEEMCFTDGDTSIIQSGGSHRDVRSIITGQQYESHHIPARSVFSDNANDLPTIALTKDDHTKTSSFRGRMGRTYKPFIPGNTEYPNHKGSIEEKVDQGLIAEIIKDEIFEIKDAFGDKYDGAIKQYIAAMIEYIKKNGTPKT